VWRTVYDALVCGALVRGVIVCGANHYALYTVIGQLRGTLVCGAPYLDRIVKAALERTGEIF